MPPLSKADFTKLVCQQYKNLALGGYKGMLQIKVRASIDILKPILDGICASIAAKLKAATPWSPEYAFDGTTLTIYFNAADPGGIFVVTETDTNTVVAEI